jgi:hypothetical protein
MIGGRLNMLAAVERNQATAQKIRLGAGPVAPDFQSIGDPLPCFAWSNDSREFQDGEKSAQLEDARAMFALGADLQEDDEIASITDRAGNVTIAGRLQVMGPVQFKHNHLEAALRRIG